MHYLIDDFESYIIYLMGQNLWDKIFVGQKFRHRAKISLILSDEVLLKFCLSVIYVFAVFWTKPNKDATETFYKRHLLKCQRDNFAQDICKMIYRQFRNLCNKNNQILDNILKGFRRHIIRHWLSACE